MEILKGHRIEMGKNIVVAVDESEENMCTSEWACKHLSEIEAGKVMKQQISKNNSYII